jgi:hypothetical protein
MSDPTSLDRLNDIVLTGTVGWWPLAPGWYVLLSIATLALVFLGWRSWKSWRRNEYRRQALEELQRIRQDPQARSLAALPALLKRVALHAWPRPVVAPLSGPDWHAFLDRTSGQTAFASGAGEALDRLSYGTGEEQRLSPADENTLLRASEFWIRKHACRPEGD